MKTSGDKFLEYIEGFVIFIIPFVLALVVDSFLLNSINNSFLSSELYSLIPIILPVGTALILLVVELLVLKDKSKVLRNGMIIGFVVSILWLIYMRVSFTG